MEHLEKQVTSTSSDVTAPQEVIDALITLTRAGLLTWREDLTVRPTFKLENDMLNHVIDADEDDVAGYYMHITHDQSKAIKKAIQMERQDLAAIRKAEAAGKS